VLVRLRHSTTSPGQVTGYAVGLARHTARDGGVIWYGGGKLAADLTLPKLRARWHPPAGHDPYSVAELPAAVVRAVLRNKVTMAAHQARDETGFFARLHEAGVLVRARFSETDPGQVTGYAVTLPGHTGPEGAPQWYGGGRPAAAADAAWAAADTLHVAARVLRSPALRCAADAYDRAARAGYGRIPRRSRDGDRLRATARLLAMTGDLTDDTIVLTAALMANLAALAAAVAELRQAQQHAAQATAARSAAQHMDAAMTQASSQAPRPARGEAPRGGEAARAAGRARTDSPISLSAGLRAAAHQTPAAPHPHSGRGSLPPKRAGPRR
jgi:hypothetical protein